MREYKALRALLGGESVEVEGCTFRATPDQELHPGDWYIGERNTGPKLGTVREVDCDNGWVLSNEPIYAYNIGECVRVEPIDL